MPRADSSAAGKVEGGLTKGIRVILGQLAQMAVATPNLIEANSNAVGQALGEEYHSRTQGWERRGHPGVPEGRGGGYRPEENFTHTPQSDLMKEVWSGTRQLLGTKLSAIEHLLCDKGGTGYWGARTNKALPSRLKTIIRIAAP